MSKVAIIIAFDLHGVTGTNKRAVYTRIKEDLAKLRLRKYLVTKEGNQTKLPANTFVGILSGKPLFKKDAATIRDVAREKVLRIIARHHKEATVLVFVGRQWAWAKARVS